MAGKNVVQCIGPTYHLDDRKAAVQSAVNMYVEVIEAEGESRPRNLVSIPGHVSVYTGAGEIRNARIVGDVRYFVIGSTIVKYVPATDTYTTISTALLTSTGYVGMAHNATQLAIVDGAYLYVLTLATDSLTRVTSTGWLGSDDVYELDGYGIFVDPNTEQFYISAIDDFTTFDALDFSSADSQPDKIITHRVLHRELWLLGEISGEIWIDSGDSAFPFARYNSATLDVGVVGKRAAIVAADTLFWIGKTQRGSGIVYMAQGHTPTRVSNRAVEQALAKSTDLSAATMWAYQVDGHEFVGINAPGLTTTWVFDAAAQQWHERGDWTSSGWAQYPLTLFVPVPGGMLAAGNDSKVYRLVPTTDTAWAAAGGSFVRERTWPHLITPGLEPLTFFGLELGCTTGYGGNVTLEISNDGGHTFGPPLLRSLGVTGRFMQRVRWLGLGTAFDRVFRIRCSDRVPFTIYSASLQT